nr:zinc finger protein 397-like isoform X1 [Zootoca vivipara]
MCPPTLIANHFFAFVFLDSIVCVFVCLFSPGRNAPFSSGRPPGSSDYWGPLSQLQLFCHQANFIRSEPSSLRAPWTNHLSVSSNIKNWQGSSFPWNQKAKRFIASFLAERVGMKMIEQKYAGTEPKAGSEGATEPIRAVYSEYMTKQSGCGTSEGSKGGPGKGRQEQWEAQWQQFLKTLETLHPEGRSPPETTESATWEDAKAFLASFEQVAKACRWPRGEWAARLLPALSGEADEAFRSLEAGDREDYRKVKAAILRGAALRTEAERQHFRHFCCQQVEDPRRIHLQLQDLCHQWLKPERRSKEQILELLVLEQFLASLPPKLQSWIRAGGPESCSQAVALAEEFLIASQQDLAEAEEWQFQEPMQDTCVDSVDAEEVPSDVAQGRIYKDRDGEISLLGDDIKSSSNSGLLLPPEGREMAEVVLSKVGFGEHSNASCGRGLGVQVEEGLPNSKETGVPLHMFERTPTQPGQQTTFWQVLPEDDGNVLSFGEQKSCCIKKETSQRGETSPEDIHRACAEVPQWDFPLTSETHEQRCEGKGRQKKRVGREGERNDYTELIPGVVILTSSGPIEGGKLPFSGYGRKCNDKSGLVVSHPGEDPSERPPWGKESQTKHCFCKPWGMLTGGKQHSPAECGRSSFVGHQNICTEEEPKENLEGGQSFRCRLQNHQNVPSGRKKHECSTCRKSFTSRAGLTKHQRIHTGEKPYRCLECGKSFSWGENLWIHRRVHTREKPYKCSHCSNCFSQRADLKIHQRIHTGEKPYKCPECDKSFRRRQHLMGHQRTHSRE